MAYYFLIYKVYETGHRSEKEKILKADLFFENLAIVLMAGMLQESKVKVADTRAYREGNLISYPIQL